MAAFYQKRIPRNEIALLFQLLYNQILMTEIEIRYSAITLE